MAKGTTAAELAESLIFGGACLKPVCKQQVFDFLNECSNSVFHSSWNVSLQTPIRIPRHAHKGVNKTEGSNARKMALCDKNSVVYFVALSRACALT